MNDVSLSREHYSRDVVHGEIGNATKTSLNRNTRYEFATRQFETYLDEKGRCCEIHTVWDLLLSTFMQITCVQSN